MLVKKKIKIPNYIKSLTSTYRRCLVLVQRIKIPISVYYGPLVYRITVVAFVFYALNNIVLFIVFKTNCYRIMKLTGDLRVTTTLLCLMNSLTTF